MNKSMLTSILQQATCYFEDGLSYGAWTEAQEEGWRAALEQAALIVSTTNKLATEQMRTPRFNPPDADLSWVGEAIEAWHQSVDCLNSIHEAIEAGHITTPEEWRRDLRFSWNPSQQRRTL